MEEDALQRFEALQWRVRQAVAAARDARDERSAVIQVERLTAELEATARELDGLRAAMRTRASIEQAKGIVMGLHSCGEQEAFLELVRISQTTQTKLRDVAAGLVAQVSTTSGEVPRIELTGQPSDISRAS
jgi:AmiR/NasT family two-component response regulator